MDAIDLGRKISASSLPEQSEPSKEEPMTVYPTLYIDGDGDELSNLPASGRMVVQYKKVSSTERTDRTGKKSASVNLDIIKILSAAPNKEKSASEHLDELATEIAGD